VPLCETRTISPLAFCPSPFHTEPQSHRDYTEDKKFPHYFHLTSPHLTSHCISISPAPLPLFCAPPDRPFVSCSGSLRARSCRYARKCLRVKNHPATRRRPSVVLDKTPLLSSLWGFVVGVCFPWVPLLRSVTHG
jgi:hypothetical protein